MPAGQAGPKVYPSTPVKARHAKVPTIPPQGAKTGRSQGIPTSGLATLEEDIPNSTSSLHTGQPKQSSEYTYTHTHMQACECSHTPTHALTVREEPSR